MERKHITGEKLEAIEKTCPNCGKVFSCSQSTQKYCSPECRKGYKRKNLAKKLCEYCGTQFWTALPNQKYCRRECEREAAISRQLKKFIGPILELPTATKGAINELFVAAELMLRGCNVFRALSPSCFCDLIAEKNKQIWYVEVRSGSVTTTGKVRYPKSKHDRQGCVYAVYIYKESRVMFFLDNEELSL